MGKDVKMIAEDVSEEEDAEMENVKVVEKIKKNKKSKAIKRKSN